MIRQTENSQVIEEDKKDTKLHDREALFILFAIAMLPSYVVPSPMQMHSKECISGWITAFLVMILASGVFNVITLKILNRVATVKQMDSYQEVAYNISNSNRGYIFLITAAKFIFIAITVAFNVDYCAGYLSSLALTSSSTSAAASYGVYVCGVFVITGLLFLPFWRLRKQSIRDNRADLRMYAYIFCLGFVLQFIFMFAMILTSAIQPSENPRHILNGALYDQLTKNGSIQNYR